MLFDLVIFALRMGTVVINPGNKIINFSFPEKLPACGFEKFGNEARTIEDKSLLILNICLNRPLKMF